MLSNFCWKVILCYNVYLTFPIVCQSICTKNCSTASIDINNKSSQDVILCSIETKKCPNTTGLDPSKPEEVKIANWYVYEDPSDNRFRKIGLNVSWSPSDDASIKEIQSYKLNLIDPNSTVRAEVYFCLHKQLDFHKHSQAVFFYDCFGGFDNVNILPGQNWKISVENFPEPVNYVKNKIMYISINIPNCHEKRLEKVNRCFQESMFTVSIFNHSCTNRYVYISYNIPSYFGTAANIWLGNAENKTDIIKLGENLQLNGTYKLVISKKYVLSKKYFIKVIGNNITDFSKMEILDLSHCPVVVDHTLTIIVIIISIVILLILTIVVIVKCFYKRNTSKLISEQDYILQDEVEPQSELMPQQNSVYLVFVDDHPLHKEIVSSFATFLMRDLGFNIISELYQTREISEDLTGWIEKSLQHSKKVLVIWSPKALQRWKMHCVDDNVLDKNDMFTPVIKHIKKDLFRHNNLLKYFFAYFDYCSKEDIPQEFINDYSLSPFKLMNQIEELYFRLQGIEMYASGAVIKQEKVDFEKYIDPSINKFGHVLQKQIDEMCKYVKTEPLWYNMQCSYLKEVNLAALNCNTETNCKIEKNCLKVIPPFVPTAECLLSNKTEHEDDNDFDDSINQSSQVIVNTSEDWNDLCVNSGNIYQTESNVSHLDSSAELSNGFISFNTKESVKFANQYYKKADINEFDLAKAETTHSDDNVIIAKQSQVTDYLDLLVPNSCKNETIVSSTIDHYNNKELTSNGVLLQCDQLPVTSQPNQCSSSGKSRNIILKKDEKELKLVVPLVSFERNNDPMQSLVLLNQQNGCML